MEINYLSNNIKYLQDEIYPREFLEQNPCLGRLIILPIILADTTLEVIKLVAIIVEKVAQCALHLLGAFLCCCSRDCTICHVIEDAVQAVVALGGIVLIPLHLVCKISQGFQSPASLGNHSPGCFSREHRHREVEIEPRVQPQADDRIFQPPEGLPAWNAIPWPEAAWPIQPVEPVEGAAEEGAEIEGALRVQNLPNEA